MTTEVLARGGGQPGETAPAATGVGGGRRGLTPGDARAIAVLVGLTALVAWNRAVFDSWLARFDLMTFFLPWYHLLGERLRDLEVPAWNPHLFSGTPLAGDPESGWGYLPAMLGAALLPIIAAFKAMVALHLLVAGLATYALARILGMGALAALGAAGIFVFGPFLKWTTHCCLIFSQWATWVPLALLGVELAMRARRWRERIVPWCLTGFAVSQSLAGWIGEGWLYALGLPVAYAAYRALVPPAGGEPLRPRLLAGAATAAAGPALGLALGAAGVLPRLAFSAESYLAGGYEQLPGGGVLNPPWTPERLLGSLFGSGYDARSAALGGAVVVLAGVAVLGGRGRRRLAVVPFFAALTLVPPLLALESSPFHPLFGLIPRWREFHEHDAWRAIALMSVGPALLAGAGIESIAAWRGRWRLLPVVLLPLLGLLAVATGLRGDRYAIATPPLLAAAAATALLAAVVLLPPLNPPLPRRGRRRPSRGRGGAGGGRWAAVALLAIAFAQPTGLELSGSWLGWPRDASWEPWWRGDPRRTGVAALARDVSPVDPGGAGEFLQGRLAAEGPFRYAGYGGVGRPEQWPPTPNYMERRLDPAIGAILTNGRPLALGLYDVQGYDPLQLGRYVEFVAALNGYPIDYHVAYVMPEGVGSPLLDLLDVRYLVVDAALPVTRDDVAVIAANAREVFRSGRAVVYQRLANPPHAWVVHEGRSVARGEALPLLTSGAVDPRRTALVEGALPPGLAEAGTLEPVGPEPPPLESARVERYEPERIELAVTMGTPGLLVVSEVWESGWRAYVGGERVAIVPTFHALRGVPVPAGESRVVLRYEPPALRAGLAVSGGTLVLMLIACGAAGWDRGRRSRRSRFAIAGSSRDSRRRSWGPRSRLPSRRASPPSA